MIFHIDKDRFDRLRSQGYQLTMSRYNATAVDGDTTYHLIEGERGSCRYCGNMVFDSLKAETPADLDMEKMKLAL